MKFLTSQIAYFFQNQSSKRNVKFLLVFLAFLIAMITVYSILFHYLMDYEGQQHSWVTGFYWSLTVMSTLGFGDITFQSDLGRVFSILVLLSGVLFLLVLLPFTFIQFFYSPWIEAQNKARYPQELPEYSRGHVIFTNFDDIVVSIIRKISDYSFDYIIIVDELKKAIELYDLGYKVGFGALDDPETYRKMRAEKARLVYASNGDEINTNIAFTIRELTQDTTIVTKADSHNSVDILTLAGSNLVIEPHKMIGASFARRTLSGNASATPIGSIEDLIIAEAPAMGTPMIGKTLMELQLRNKLGINVVGFWEHGLFIQAKPDYVINDSTVLVILGTQEAIDNYNDIFIIFNHSTDPIIIIGSGRVGNSVAENLLLRGLDFVLIEENESRVSYPDKTILGNAADYEILQKAGIDKAPSIIISTGNDDMNIYLTIYCRRLRSDIQIISRANADKNMTTLTRAGADIIMSFSSLATNEVFNYIQENKILMLAEGIDLFTSIVPNSLTGKKLSESNIRQDTGCNVVAIKQNDDMSVNPGPETILIDNSSLLIIGSKESEAKFIKKYFS